jgi:hypothetical protein
VTHHRSDCRWQCIQTGFGAKADGHPERTYTQRAYRKEAGRLILWTIVERGLAKD